MFKISKSTILLFTIACFFFSSCKKGEFEDYYSRPANLSDPIYQQLVAKGNFTSLLKCIDKAGYKETLSAGGFWTLFAADDAAFDKYLQEVGKNSVDDLDSITIRKIVTYNLVYNAYRDDELFKYQAAGQATSLKPDFAYKRKTAYYDFVYPETVGSRTRKIVNTNVNGGGYVEADNGNKYIPYFVNEALTGLGTSALEYNSFYSTNTFGGFNVAGAKVTDKNIIAENGIIHIVDRVILPLQNLDQYIASKNDYSEFKRLLDLASTYTYNAAVSKRYQALSKMIDSVYVKAYNSGLAFSPNNENFTTSGTDAQINGYTMFVPRNAELLAYTKNILTHYQKFEFAPPAVLYDFLNAHMWRSSVWPNKLNTFQNSAGETANFAASDILERKVLSNGLFYGIGSVQDADVFRTVYGKPYLDPKFTLMTMAIDASGLKTLIKIPTAKYTMFMMPNTTIRAAGFDYYPDRSNWGYLKPATVGTIDISDATKARVFRILETSILPTRGGELDDLSGKGIVEAYNGEYVKYDAGKIYSSGGEEVTPATFITVDSSKNTVNGKAYYVNGLLSFTEKPIANRIQALALASPTEFGSFWSYLSANPIYTAADQSILGTALGSYYTVLIPNNAAIVQAVKDGYLPGTVATGVPNFAPTLATDIEKVQKFIYYHLIDKNTVVTDGKKFGAFPSLLKNINGDVLYVTVNNFAKDDMTLRDSYNNNVTLNLAKSNFLAYRTVIHSLNSYLKYNDK
jgi:uncharacterized surface protein with fasciclin (FAS1) repeats